MGRKRKKGIVSRLLTSGKQLENALALVGVNGPRPSINGLMPSVSKVCLEKKKRGKKSTIATIYDGMTDVLSKIFSFDGIDDELPFDVEYGPYEQRYPLKTKKKGKSSLKLPKINTFHDDDDDYDSSLERKFIKFYRDINNENDAIEFKTIKEFNDFCDKNDYFVSKVDADNLQRWSVIHCCLFPLDNSYGVKSIVTDNSYGGLYWSVSDETMASELF